MDLEVGVPSPMGLNRRAFKIFEESTLGGGGHGIYMGAIQKHVSFRESEFFR